MSIARLFTQTASVETRVGVAAAGDKFADPVDVACFVNSGRAERISTADRSEVLSQTTLYAPVASAAAFTPGSKVTVNGHQSRVVTVFLRNSAGPASAHHVQVALV